MKKLSIYLMVLFAAFQLQSCGDDEKVIEDDEIIVEEKANLSVYGEEEIDFPFVASGDAGTNDGFNHTNIFLYGTEFSEGNTLEAGADFIVIFFAHTTEKLVVNNFTAIESSDNSSAELILEGAKFTYDYDPNVEGPNAISPDSGSLNLISYDETSGKIELEYKFTFNNGKSLEGYYKGDFNYLGLVD